MQQDAPQYRGSIYLDGYTYRISLRFHEGQRQKTVEIPHTHPQYELHSVFEGEILLEQEGLPPIVLQAGDCCLIPPLVYHLRRCGSDATKCCAVYIDCPKGAPFSTDGGGCVDLRCASAVMNCLHALEAELSERKIGSDSSIQCLLTLLLICMIRELNNQLCAIPLVSKGKRPLTIISPAITGRISKPGIWRSISASPPGSFPASCTSAMAAPSGSTCWRSGFTMPAGS